MPKKPDFQIDTSNSLEFVASSIKENNETMDLLLKEMRNISDRIGDVCELTTFKRIEEKINDVQSGIRNLRDNTQAQVSLAPARAAQPAAPAPKTTMPEPQQNLPPPPELLNPGLVVRYKDWQDFFAFASGAQTVAFGYREADRTFEVDALKNNQVAVYIGEMPKTATLLKIFLSKQLGISAEKVFEGAISRT